MDLFQWTEQPWRTAWNVLECSMSLNFAQLLRRFEHACHVRWRFSHEKHLKRSPYLTIHNILNHLIFTWSSQLSKNLKLRVHWADCRDSYHSWSKNVTQCALGSNYISPEPEVPILPHIAKDLLFGFGTIGVVYYHATCETRLHGLGGDELQLPRERTSLNLRCSLPSNTDLPWGWEWPGSSFQ